MAAYRRVYDSRHQQADCQELGSAPEPYARQSSMGYLYLFTSFVCFPFISFVVYCLCVVLATVHDEITIIIG